MKHNAGAERAVLAGVCQYGREAFYDIADIVTANTFSASDANQATWKCVEQILTESEKVDATSILAQAETNGLSIFFKKKEDVEFLRSLFIFPIRLENVRQFAKQIAKLEIIKKEQNALLAAHHELDMFDGTESIDKIVGIAENAIFEVSNEINSQNDNTPKLMGEGAAARLKNLAENPIEMVGIPSPWPIYNDLIGGGCRPGVTLFAARVKIGKSMYCLNYGLHVADKLKIPVLYIDTEMSKEEQENRVVACVSEIDSRLIETGKYGAMPYLKEKVLKSAEYLNTIPFYHKWVGGLPFEAITSIMRRWIHSVVGFGENGKPNPHFIIYDYFKMMDSSELDKMQEYQAIGFQISYLSDFCKKYNTPCLACVQTNRDGITKDTSDIISQSDRLMWLCVAGTVFKRKDKEEMVEDGVHNGNRKLTLLEGRFGEPLEQGDYICLNLDGAKSKIKEIGLKSKLAQQQKTQNSGFEIDTDDTHEETLEL